jgi:hypothetical protein
MLDRSLVRDFNRMFANFDVYFRDIEKEYGRGLFPTISIPSLQNTINETAVVHSDGKKTIYYKNGMVHREDGPAITYNDGKQFEEYWLNGQKVTKEEVSSLREKQEEEKEYSVYIGDREYKVKGKKKLAELENLLK